MADYESVLCVKNEVFVYQIPARTTNRGYRAADWKLEEPDWTGKLRVVAKGRDLTIKLEDKNSGELFALCPVEAYPSPVIEQVLDSSRYFVIRIQDGSNRHAFIGIGFTDRSDSFDLLVAIQDHFKYVKREEAEKTESTNAESLDSQPKLDLGFKEGQTIKINIATKKPGDSTPSNKPRPKANLGGGLLPPPPGSSSKIVPPPRPAGIIAQRTSVPATNKTAGSQPQATNLDLLLDLGPSSNIPSSKTPASASSASDEWDEFTGALSTKLSIKPNTTTATTTQRAATGWENFE